jgi:hypothetical protein
VKDRINQIEGNERVWTRDEIFSRKPEQWRMPPITSAGDINSIRLGYPTLFTREFAAELLRETEWESQIDFVPDLPRDVMDPVGDGEMQCPLCNDTRVVNVPHKGKLTGLLVLYGQRCPCIVYRRFRTVWTANVERDFQNVILSKMEPTTEVALSAETQKGILDYVKSHREDSFFLFGPPGTGKTTVSVGLYRIALFMSIQEQEKRRVHYTNVWRVMASVLLDEHVAKAKEEDPENPAPTPTVTIQKIKNVVAKGCRPRLFLDELDKVIMTPFKRNRLIEIVDAVYANGGQIVATSNMNKAQLIREWGEDTAGTILRRIKEGQGRHEVNFGEPIEAASSGTFLRGYGDLANAPSPISTSVRPVVTRPSPSPTSGRGPRIKIFGRS